MSLLFLLNLTLTSSISLYTSCTCLTSSLLLYSNWTLLTSIGPITIISYLLYFLNLLFPPRNHLFINLFLIINSNNGSIHCINDLLIFINPPIFNSINPISHFSPSINHSSQLYLIIRLIVILDNDLTLHLTSLLFH